MLGAHPRSVECGYLTCMLACGHMLGSLRISEPIALVIMMLAVEQDEPTVRALAANHGELFDSAAAVDSVP